jgi:thioredoxin reductase (NADPH)
MREVIIIGSGCAGLSAAIYTARANLKPLLLSGSQPGGQLITTTDVENYPGFEHGINGFELTETMRKQAARFGAEFVGESVVEVDFSKSPLSVITDGDKRYDAETIIIATGATARYLGLESEQQLMGRGVSACATCDGAFYRDVPVCVVGGGDSAIEEALFLTRFASKVTIIHRRDELRASKIMADRAFANEKIDFLWDSVVTEVLDVAKGAVEGARVKNLKTGEEHVLPIEGFFLGIGHTPNTAPFKGVLDMDEKGYLIAENTRTKIPGVFAAGDVQDSIYRQAITAAGSGCMAALEAERYLEAKQDQA